MSSPNPAASKWIPLEASPDVRSRSDLERRRNTLLIRDQILSIMLDLHIHIIGLQSGTSLPYLFSLRWIPPILPTRQSQSPHLTPSLKSLVGRTPRTPPQSRVPRPILPRPGFPAIHAETGTCGVVVVPFEGKVGGGAEG